MRTHAALLALCGGLALAAPGQADPSLECSINSGSQVETARCLAGVEEAAETAMGVFLDSARRAAEELDGVTRRDVALPALEAAQQAWLAYRDSQCDYVGALFGGGSGTGIGIRSCRIEMARDRMKTLRATLY